MVTPPSVTAGLQGPDKEYIQKLADEVNQLGLARREREAYITQNKGMSAGAQQIAAGIGLQIDAFNEQQKAAARSASAVEKMNAGVQKLPSQFLGVFTALQAGQDPVNTLLAQGLRMVETFGSVGAAAEGAGLFVASLANPIGIAAAAVGALAVAYVQGAAEAEAFNKTLILSGNAVGTSSDSLMDAAQSIDALNFGITQSRAAEVINTIAASGSVGAESLERFAQSALTFEKAGGGSADSVAKAFSSLAGDPLGSLESLNKSMNFLTLETYNQVKALTEQGRTVEAAKVAQDAYADAIDTRVPGLVQNLGLVEKAWQAIKGGAAEAWDSVLGIGRATTNKQKMDAAFDEIKTIQNLPSFFITDANRSAQLKAQWDIVNALEQEAIATARTAAEKKKQNDATKAGIELSKAASKYDTPAEQKRRGVLEATSRYETVLANPQLSESERKQAEANYLKVVTGITGSGESKPKEPGSRPSTVSFSQSQSQSQTQSQEAIQKKELEDFLKSRQLVADRRNQDSEAIAAASRAEEAAAVKSIQTIEERITGLKSEELVLQRSRELNVSLAEAIEIVAIERLKEQQKGRNHGSEGWEGIQKEIDKRQELLLAMSAKNSREKGEETEKKAATKSEEAAKKAQEQWKATADSINKGLTDAFMKSLESGKDFGKNLREALKEQFKNLVLKPTISAMLSPVSGALSSLVNGTMGGGGGGGGVDGGLSTLFSLGSTAYQAYQGQGLLGSAWNGISGLFGGGGMSAATSAAASAAAEAAAAAATAAAETAALSGTAIDAAAALAAQANAATAAGGAAAAGGGSLAAGGVYALIALAVINALGGMRSESIVGSGLAGTLGGNSPLTPWQEWREGGTLLDGSSFSTHNPLEALDQHRAELARLRENGQGDSNYAVGLQAVVTDLERTTRGLATQTAVLDREITKGYKSYRDGVVQMADSLGLAGSSVEDFAYTLGAQDLNLMGLKPEEIQAKIAATFGKAGTAMAQQLLGSWKEVTDTVINTWIDTTDPHNAVYTTETTTNTRMEYQASEYAKVGETAIQTLERLSTSFNALNEAADALGFGIQNGSLALADFADDFIEAFGGLERFTASTGAFLQNYYTDAERREYLISSGVRQAEKLGIKGLTEDSLRKGTREQFRDFVNTAATNPELYRDALDLANYLSPIFAAYEQQAPVVQEVANAVDELTQKFTGAKEALLNDAKSLSADLLRAQGKEGEAKALERANYLAGFSDLDEVRRQELATLYDINMATRRAIEVQNERNGLQNELNALTDDSTQALTRQRDALDESNRALFDNVQAVKLQKTIAEELPGVLDKYLSPEQRRQSQYNQVTADLNAAGLKVSTDQLMGLSKAQIGAVAVEIYNLAGVSDEARLAIVRAAGALADLKDADVDNAFAALERAVDAQRTVLSEAISELTTVFETARDAAKSLFGEVESAVQYQGDEGRAFISNALRVATSTGYLPDSEKFTEAVSNATGALGQQMFATQAESDYQRLVLANELKGLQDISGDQLEKAKTQLETLEEQLKVQRQQVEALGGIDAGVLSVEQAIDRLATAMNGAQATPRTPTTTLKGAGGASYDLTTGTGQTSSGVAFSGSAIKEAALKAISEGASPQQIYNIIRDSGFTVAQAEQMAGSAPGSLQKLEAEMGWAAAYGGTGSYSKQSAYGASALVEPTAYDPTAAGNGNQQIVSALQDVRAELIEVRRQNDQLQYAATRTADAVNGRPEAPMLVENV